MIQIWQFCRPAHGDPLSRITVVRLLAAIMFSGIFLADMTAVSGSETVPGPPGPGIQVEFHEGLLTLRASQAPFVDVIRAIGAEAGFETRVYGDLDVKLDRRLDAVPLERALEDLLKGVSNAMRFNGTPDRQLTEIFLYGDTGTATARKEPLTETLENTIVTQTLDSERANDIDRSVERARAGDHEAIVELAGLLRENTDPAVRGAAAVALGKIGDVTAIDILQNGVRDNSRMVRIRAIRALAIIRNDQSTQVLADVLFNHSDIRTRLLAAWALGQQGTPLAKSYLETAQDDGNELVRNAVTRARSGGETKLEP